MPPPAGLEPGTAVFKKCTTADETLPCGQKMTKGDFAVALRWLERIPVGRDPQRLTFEDDDTKKPQLVDAASFVRVLDPSAKEITKKAVLKATPERPFGPWYSEPAHHHHAGRERRGRAPSSCSDVLRRRWAVALSELVASVLSGFDVVTSSLISFSFVLDVLGTTIASMGRSAVA